MAEYDDYLDDAAGRLVIGWKAYLATLDSPIKQVINYVDAGLTPPYVWIFPGLFTPSHWAAQMQRQTTLVMARIVLGNSTSGIDGVLMRALWRILPTASNYFLARQGLCFTDGDTPVRYLDVEKVGFEQVSAFGAFAGFDQVGVDYAHALSFTVENEQIGW